MFENGKVFTLLFLNSKKLKKKKMEELVKQLKGLTYENAISLLGKKGLIHRVSLVNGEPLVFTRDFNPYRVNLELENNLVTNVTFG